MLLSEFFFTSICFHELTFRWWISITLDNHYGVITFHYKLVFRLKHEVGGAWGRHRFSGARPHWRMITTPSRHRWKSDRVKDSGGTRQIINFCRFIPWSENKALIYEVAWEFLSCRKQPYSSLKNAFVARNKNCWTKLRCCYFKLEGRTFN